MWTEPLPHFPFHSWCYMEIRQPQITHPCDSFQMKFPLYSLPIKEEVELPEEQRPGQFRICQLSLKPALLSPPWRSLSCFCACCSQLLPSSFTHRPSQVRMVLPPFPLELLMDHYRMRATYSLILPALPLEGNKKDTRPAQSQRQDLNLIPPGLICANKIVPASAASSVRGSGWGCVLR